MTKKITILTTRQNFRWTSMQEILPALEQCWLLGAENRSVKASIINVDELSLKKAFPDLIQSEVIVVTAFNETIARFMVEIRKSLGLTIPFIFHVHGLATIGLWPLDHFSVFPWLDSGDIFVGTCPGDIHCLKLISDDLKSALVPFPFFPLNTTVTDSPERVFAYVGRLSDQKNIDVAIKAYYQLFKEMNSLPDFVIYGEEDHFGSPNMGIKSSSVLDDLRALVKELQLESKVHFKGFVKREEIVSILGKNHIFVSASTHSDENFGMALMRSLELGGKAVVTHWGGHILFGKSLPERVQLVPVHFQEARPKPDVDAFKNALRKSLEENGSSEFPKTFSPDEVSKAFFQLVDVTNFQANPIRLSSFSQKLFERKKSFNQSVDLQKIFESYDDPFAREFLKAYQQDL